MGEALGGDVKQLAVPALVTKNPRQIYEVWLPTVDGTRWSGPSLARLLDDAAVHLMESVPKASAERMRRYELCPWIVLRKVKVDLKWRHQKVDRRWEGRISVLVTVWEGERFYTVEPLRLDGLSFAVKSLADLEGALSRKLIEIAKDRGLDGFDSFAARDHEYLEIIGFETDLPSILPTQPKRRKKKKDEKKKAKKKSKKKKAEESEEKKTERRLVPPIELRQVGDDLTHRALDDRLGRAYRRDSIVEEVRRQLDHEGTGILLVGPSGAGKTAIVHEVVRRMADEVASIRDRRDVWQVDGNRIIAGMSVVGAWERRVQNMVRELEARQDILYVDDLPSLVYTGRSAHSDTNVAGFLEPILARGELRIIGECTPERLLAVRDEAPGFFSRFRIITVDGMDERDALLVLVSTARALAEHANVSFDPDALETILALTRRFEAGRHNPGKAVSLLLRLVRDHKRVERDELGRRRFTRKHVVDLYGREAGLPSFVLWEEEARPFSEIERFFTERIVAQPNAVEAATDVVALLEQGLNDPERPLATFLFVGPTGVGKTETAKALAAFLFGAKERLIRFDMSEFMTPHTVGRLIGDRFHPDGELTRRVEQQPFSVVLLDEIEKAHPSIFDALLQVLGEGRLTNAAGRTVDFKSTIIVMTSNLGVREAGKRLGFDARTDQKFARHYRDAAERHFAPEFFNRIDRIVPFGYLGRDAIVPLVERMLGQMLSRRGLLRSNVVVDVEPRLVDLLVDRGFDERYGARSVRRILEHELAVPLAEHLVRAHRAALTSVELYEQTGRIAMDVEHPARAASVDAAELAPLASWSDVIERHEEITAMLEAARRSSAADKLRAEHSELLARFNAGDREGEGRLLSIASLFERATLISEALDRFDEQYLVVSGFEEREKLESPSDWWERKTIARMNVRVVREGRRPLDDEIRDRLASVELDAGGLVFRLTAAVEAEARPRLVRVEPAVRHVREPEAARTLTTIFLEGWADLLAARIFAKKDGTWAGHDHVPEGGDAFALELAGPAAEMIVAPELGYHLHELAVGPDRLLDLFRVEEVGDGTPSLERLSKLDTDAETWREERSKGPVEPRPALPLVRTFGPDSGFDAKALRRRTQLTIYAEAKKRTAE